METLLGLFDGSDEVKSEGAAVGLAVVAAVGLSLWLKVRVAVG